ncbi:MAG: hypothetical protein ACI9WU_003135 [Myxococcota bacterium]|jgi:hypothetical protein
MSVKQFLSAFLLLLGFFFEAGFGKPEPLLYIDAGTEADASQRA